MAFAPEYKIVLDVACNEATQNEFLGKLKKIPEFGIVRTDQGNEKFNIVRGVLEGVARIMKAQGAKDKLEKLMTSTRPSELAKILDDVFEDDEEKEEFAKLLNSTAYSRVGVVKWDGDVDALYFSVIPETKKIKDVKVRKDMMDVFEPLCVFAARLGAIYKLIDKSLGRS